MVCKVFQYEYKDGSIIYLNATDRASPDLVLELYIEWYNRDFAPEENCPERHFEDFTFLCSFCPIDFYEESRSVE